MEVFPPLSMEVCLLPNTEVRLLRNMAAYLHLSMGECPLPNTGDFPPLNMEVYRLHSMVVCPPPSMEAYLLPNMEGFPHLREEVCLLLRQTLTRATFHRGLIF